MPLYTFRRAGFEAAIFGLYYQRVLLELLRIRNVKELHDDGLRWQEA